MPLNRAPLPPYVRGISSGGFGTFGTASAGPFEQLPLSNQAYSAGADFLRMDFDTPAQTGDTIWPVTLIGAAAVGTTVRAPFGRSCVPMINAAAAGNGIQIQYCTGGRTTTGSNRAINVVAYAVNTRDAVDGALVAGDYIGAPPNSGAVGNTTAGTGLRAYFIGVAARNTVTPILTTAGDVANLTNYVGFHFKLGSSSLNLPNLVARSSGGSQTVFTRNSTNSVIQMAGTLGSATLAVRSIGPSYVDFWEFAGSTSPNTATTFNWLNQGGGTVAGGNFSATLFPTVAYVLDGVAEDGLQLLRVIQASAQP